MSAIRRIEDGWALAIVRTVGVVWISSGASDARTRVRILYSPPLFLPVADFVPVDIANRDSAEPRSYQLVLFEGDSVFAR